MKCFSFSDTYMEQLQLLKSDKYRTELFSNLEKLKEYMIEDEYQDVYDAIEEVVELKSSGNIITTHSYGIFSEWILQDCEAFMQMMIEDLMDWFIFETNPLECKLFCIGMHIDDYEFSDDDLERITYGIMVNFIENGIPCPDVVLVPTLDYKKKMENGYFILGLK